MASPLLEFIAREHPAFVHVPLGLVVTLPLAMLASFQPERSHNWTRTAFFMAIVALGSSILAVGSGLLWGRQINLIPEGAFFPPVSSSAQVLQRMLQLHEIAALSGIGVGTVCVWLLWRAWHPLDRVANEPGGYLRHQQGRRLWERGVGAPALVLGLLWLGAWGFCGKLGGIMVFGNEEINKAAAEADAAKRNDAEADLPIRALDFASLEPAQAAPMRTVSHGNRWGRVWVTASGIDAYRAGKPLPPGAYAVLSTVEDEKGRPGQSPGPLYFRESKADGTASFAFYWGRIPEGSRASLGGEDSLYWRSPNPKLSDCVSCHAGK